MGQLAIEMFDAGDQRSESKKWMPQFENATAIIFVVDLASYDQVLLERPSQNTMMEALVLFDSVVNAQWFMRNITHLLLSNVHEFKAKLAKTPLSGFFPDYSGGNDVNKAAKYILWKFNQVNRAQLNMYPYLVTSPDDTSVIRLIFAAIKETIQQNALEDGGII